MLSLQLCLSIAPLLAGAEAGNDSFPQLSLTSPYHLIADSNGQMLATPVVFTTATDDDDDDKDERDDHRAEQHSRREREDRRDGDDRKPEGGSAEGQRPQPEGLRGRPELHRPSGQPGKDGDHRPQPDHKQPPHQGPPQHGRPPAAAHGPAPSGGYHPPVMGMPPFGGMFGHGSPFGGGPGKPQVQASGHGPGNSVLTGIIFELLDQNHDGNLSRGEFQKLADAVQKSHHPPIVMPDHSGSGKGPDQSHGRPHFSRRIGPPMIHQPLPLLQARKPDGDHKPDAHYRPDRDRDRQPEHSDKDEHREHGEQGSDRHRPDGERGEKSHEHQEPRI